MKFSEIVKQAVALLQESGRVSYRALRREFDLDDETLEDLKEELIEARRVAVDEDGRILVWISAQESSSEQVRTLRDDPVSTFATEVRSGEAERRQITVMFCDLVGSTALSETLDAEDLREIMAAYQKAAGAIIERYEGHVAQYLGDGLVVYFGWPVAHEEDAGRAVQASLEIIDAVKGVEAPEPLRVRIGVATGPVVVGETGAGDASVPKAAVGETPNVAARLQGLAGPDEIVIAPTTQKLAGGAFDYDDLGKQELKGIVEPLCAWRVVRESAAVDRFEAHSGSGLTPLVGRESELALLLDRWAEAKDGEGQVVLLSGEPGIGKSRITEVLRERLAGEPHTRLRYQCSPYYTNTAFYPIIDQLKRAADFERNDSTDEQLDKLERLLSQGTNDVASVVPFFSAMLSMEQSRYSAYTGTPQKQKERTIEAMVAQVVGLASGRPMLIILEDAHWIDELTLETLTEIVDSIQDRHVLLIVTYRPEFKPPWLGYGHVTEHSLSRLTRRQGAALVASVASAHALPQIVLDQIIDRIDGVPLFAEELTKMVLEAGYLKDGGTGYETGDTMPSLEIPSTLRDSLMARLDQLETVKEVAQIAACIGRDFSYELLAAVSPMDGPTLQDALGALVKSGLVFQRGGASRVDYSFKHALMREAAADTLLRDKRQQLHERVAQALQQAYPDLGNTAPELLAYHYELAGQAAGAAECWLEAGRLAVRQAANKDAIGHLRKALECLANTLDDDTRRNKELSVYTILGPALVATEGWGSKSAKNIFEKVHTICQTLGDVRQQFPAFWGNWMFQVAGVGSGHAIGLADELLDLAEQDQSVELRLQANHAAWTTFLLSGDLRRGLTHVEAGLKLYDAGQHSGQAARYGGHDPAICGLGQGAIGRWLIGTPDRAKMDVEQAIALGRQLAHPPSVVHSLVWASWVYQFRREPAMAHTCADEAYAIATDQGLALYITMATVVRGWARAIGYNSRTGPSEILDGIQLYLKTGTNMNVTYLRGLAAEALIHFGQHDAAVAQIDQAFALMEETGEGFWKAELVRLSGEAALRAPKPDMDAAESILLDAHKVAKGQGARALELRAVTSLARLWEQQGKQTEAHELLSEIYNWFTEGFDTKDLKDAKALLEELA